MKQLPNLVLARLSSFFDRSLISVQMFPAVVLLSWDNQFSEVGSLTLVLIASPVLTAAFNSFIAQPLFLRYHREPSQPRQALDSAWIATVKGSLFLFALSLFFLSQPLIAHGASMVPWILLIAAVNCFHEYFLTYHRLLHQDHYSLRSSAISLTIFFLGLLYGFVTKDLQHVFILGLFIGCRVLGILFSYWPEVRKIGVSRGKSDWQQVDRNSLSHFSGYLFLFCLTHGHQVLAFCCYGIETVGKIAAFQAILRPFSLLVVGDQHYRFSQWVKKSDGLSLRFLLNSARWRQFRLPLLLVSILIALSPWLYRGIYGAHSSLGWAVQWLLAINVVSVAAGHYLNNFLFLSTESRSALVASLKAITLYGCFAPLALVSLTYMVSIPTLTVMTTGIWIWMSTRLSEKPSRYSGEKSTHGEPVAPEADRISPSLPIPTT